MGEAGEDDETVAVAFAQPYPFALPVVVDKVEGSVLVDHLKSMDWKAGDAAFHSKAHPPLLSKVPSMSNRQTYITPILSHSVRFCLWNCSRRLQPAATIRRLGCSTIVAGYRSRSQPGSSSS